MSDIFETTYTIALSKGDDYTFTGRHFFDKVCEMTDNGAHPKESSLFIRWFYPHVEVAPDNIDPFASLHPKYVQALNDCIEVGLLVIGVDEKTKKYRIELTELGMQHAPQKLVYDAYEDTVKRVGMFAQQIRELEQKDPKWKGMLSFLN